jgi:hypothetical protein
MSLGRLVVDLVANTGQFIQGINGATRNARSGAASITASFGTIVKAQLTADIAMRAMTGALDYFMQSLDKAGAAIDSQVSFGTLPSKFYDMQYAIESAGDSFEPVTKVMAVLSNELAAMGSAADGKGKLIQSLGLDFKELKSADPTDAIRMVAKALEQVEDPTLRARVGTELLGKAWKEAAPGLGTLASSVAGVSGVTDEMLESADTLSDAFGNAVAQASNLALVATTSLTPQLIALGSVVGGVGDNSVSLGKALATGLPIVTGLSYVALQATVNFKQFALGLAGLGAAAKALATLDKDALFAIPQQWKAGMATIANDAAIARTTIRQASEGMGKAEGERADQHGKAGAASAAAAAQAKALAAALAAAGAKAGAVDPITQSFQQIRESIMKARMESRDFDIAKFAGTKGATPALVKKYTLLVDTLAAETGLRTFRDEMKGMSKELALVGKGETESSLANLKARLEDAKVPADKVTEAVEKLRTLLGARADAAFLDDLKALNLEIDKIGKNSQQQSEIDIRAKYSDDPKKQAEMLAANTKKYVTETQEQVSEMMRKLEAEAAGIGATPLTQYVAELKEAQRLNPLITNGFIESAAAQKQANIDLEKSYEDNQRLGLDMSDEIVGGLGDILSGTKSASDGFKSMTKAVADLIVQYLILKPLRDALDGAFSGGSGGGGFIGAAVEGISTFFGGGRALGGGVGANSLHEVVEQGPELLSSGGKTYLMTGGQGGNVTPLGKGESAGGSTNIYQTINIDARGADAGVDQKIHAAMKQTKEETLAAFQIASRRGENRR